MSRAVQFLQRYRVLEGFLERQYANRRKTTSSPVIEYLHDDDSQPIRTDLNLLREIRNILSHNSGSNGEPVIEPSEETLDKLESAITYITRKHKAGHCGTDAQNILCTHPEDRLLTIMRKMHESGFSHVPIINTNGVCGVLSLRSVFDFIAENGLDAINAATTVRDVHDYTSLDRKQGDQYMFVSADTDISVIRKNFNRRWEPNHRLALVMVTHNGRPNEPLIRLLTPWDTLFDIPNTEEGN